MVVRKVYFTVTIINPLKHPISFSNNRLDASWTVTDENGNLLDDPKLFSTGLTHRNLVVKKHQLKQNTTYNFTLTIGYSGNPEKATFVMTRKTSVTPTPGNCSIT